MQRPVRPSSNLVRIAVTAVLLLSATATAAPADPTPGRISQTLATLIDFQIKADPVTARPGQIVKVTIRGAVKVGFHTYPMNYRSPQQSDGELCKLSLKGDGLVPLGPVTESSPEFVKVDADFVQLQHIKPFTWSQDLLVPADAKPGKKEVTALVTLQICNDRLCHGPDVHPPLRTSIDVAGDPVGLSPEQIQELSKRQSLKLSVKELGVPANLGPDGRMLAFSAPVNAPLTDPLAEKPAAPIDPLANDPKPTAKPKSSSSMSKKLAERITFRMEVRPARAHPGQAVTVIITGTPQPGYHTYPITRSAGDHQEGQLSKLRIEKTADLQPLWPISESDPVSKNEADDHLYLEHEHEFTWTQDVLVHPTSGAGKKTLTADITLMVCDSKTCIGPAGYPALEAVIDVDGASVPLSDDLQRRLEAKQPPVTIVTAPAVKKTEAVPQAVPVAENKDDSLLGFMALAIGSAILMLLTPCVFPMIPVTVSIFQKQSEKAKNNALLMASVYCLTIVVSLSLTMLLLGSLFITLANHPFVNLLFGFVLLAFALSLFGMFELELPSFLTRFTAAREGTGGYVGVFFMALTFTITSFTCTGPFLGPFLAAGKEAQIGTGKLIVGAVTYSTTFAAPFFFLALFPSVLKKLPKGGNWMNVVKVVMGFLELALALKFLAITDAAWNPGRPWFFNYDTVLCAWIALSVACGLYLLGLFRLPHDYPEEHLGVPRLVLATGFFGLALYLVPALWRETPLGVIGEQVVAFLPADTRPPRQPGTAAGAENSELTWHMDYRLAWEEAVRTGKPLFVDFTGINCVNCRANEKNVFSLPGVRREFARYVRVRLYTDSIPDRSLSSAEATRLGKENLALQDRTFNNLALPFYGVLKPAQDVPIEDGKLKGEHLGEWTSGKIVDPHQFEEFIRNPRGQQVALGTGGL